MKELNLETNSKEQERIKDYLQENASESLATKINEGVKIEKDGKVLINKKDLNGFIQFATNEARNQAEKGAKSAFVEDDVVFGWAIHYFEEDSIEGKLFNEDGTEYVPPKPKKEKLVEPVKIETKPQNKQASLFDFLASNEPAKVEETEVEEVHEEAISSDFDAFEEANELTDEEMDAEFEALQEEQQHGRIVDTVTSEVLDKPSIDKDLAITLYNLLDGKLEVQP